MKKIVAFFLALSMAVVMLAGCGASQTPTTTEAPKTETKAATEAAPAAETEQKELTIAGIVFKDEFTMKMVQQGYEDAAKDYGVNIVIGNSMGDLANEQQLVYSYIDMGVDGIAITPYSEEASIPILKEAYDKGIEVAVANIKLNDASFVCGGFTSQDLLNGQKLGDYTAKYLSDKYGNDLKIAIMDFDAAIPEQSKARYGGFLEELTANGVNYEIVAQQSSTSKNDNVPIVEAMLAGAPDCNVFFCTSAAFTNVVVQVVMNMGLSDKITVVGYDMGEQTATQILDEKSPLTARWSRICTPWATRPLSSWQERCAAKRPNAPGATPSIWKASSTARKIWPVFRLGWTATTSWPTADFPRFT